MIYSIPFVVLLLFLGFIKNIKASTKEGTVEFEYNEGKISLDKIKTIVEEAGEYKVE